MPTITDVLSQAYRHHQAGQLAQAEQLYRQILDASPRQSDARHLLGVAALQGGRAAEAVEHLRAAIAIESGQAAYHNHLGIASAQLGNLDEAAAAFRHALELAPQQSDLHYNLGNVFREQGDTLQAIDSFRRAIALKPNYAEALFNLGNALRSIERYDEAADCFRRALAARPNYFKALMNLAETLHDLGQLDEAEAFCRQAVAAQPQTARAHNNLGTLLRAKGSHEQAAACFQEAIRLDPGFTEAHGNLGSAWLDLKHYDEASACFRHALALNPHYAKGRNGLGAVRRAQDDIAGAIEEFRQAIALDPNLAEAHTNLGSALQDLGQHAEAAAAFRRSLELKPDFADTHFALSTALLLDGKLLEGWPHYEWRLRVKGKATPPMLQPRWQGEPLTGRSILLLAEQGMGDTLQFVRYAALLRQQGARVTLGCPEPLVRLLSSCPYLDRVASEVGQQGFDYHAELLSLPSIFGTTLETIPNDIPYLSADPSLIEQWRLRLASIPGRRIGIHWQGNPKYPADRQRSMPLAHFEPLAHVPGVRLVSLQRGLGTEQIGPLAERFEVIELGDDVDTASGAFMDTAAIMRNLDLVITSDTATAHLAGSLGVPVWLATPFSPDWRWLLHRDDSPWYPTMRLFRQLEPGNWSAVFADMAARLREGDLPAKA